MCEDGVANLQCRRGEMIDVVNVFYGRRDKTTCTPHWSIGNWKSTCYSVNALQLVSARFVFHPKVSFNTSFNSNLHSTSASLTVDGERCPIIY